MRSPHGPNLAHDRLAVDMVWEVGGRLRVHRCQALVAVAISDTGVPTAMAVVVMAGEGLEVRSIPRSKGVVAGRGLVAPLVVTSGHSLVEPVVVARVDRGCRVQVLRGAVARVRG